MKTKVYNILGKEVKTIDLDDSVFAREVSMGSIYEAIKVELANRRQGTHSTLTRREVDATTKKPYAQKGTGRARQGRIKAPHYVGGGIVFGPKPRDYSYVIPKKVKRLALKSILSLKVSSGAFKVIEDFSISSGKTKDMAKILETVSGSGRTVMVASAHDELLKRAGRNLPNLTLLTWNQLNAHDLFYSHNLLIMEKAAMELGNMYGEPKDGD
jgi:large subunit ribosomal protein L4